MNGEFDGKVFDADGSTLGADHAVTPVVAIHALVSTRFTEAFKPFREVEDRPVAPRTTKYVAVRQPDVAVARDVQVRMRPDGGIVEPDLRGTRIHRQTGALRDAGGLGTARGRRARTGLLFRSVALDAASADDLRALAGLNPYYTGEIRINGEPFTL